MGVYAYNEWDGDKMNTTIKGRPLEGRSTERNDDLSVCMIPKKVHLSWKTKDLLDSESPLITEGVKKLIELNPNWEVTIYDDAEVDAYLQEQLEPQLYALIADKHIVQKTDLWRLVKLFIEGGLYIDIDRFVNTPLDDLVDEDTKWVVPTCRDYDFSHDFMMAT